MTIAAPPEQVPDRPRLALALIVTCQLMLILDATVMNVALPHIQAGLHFSSTGLAWVMSAYTLTFGGLLLLGGRAGDILGRRRTFMIGVAIFTVASVAGVVYALIRAASNGWSDPVTVAVLVAGVALLGAFLLIEVRTREPLLPLRLFADRNRAAGFGNFFLGPASMMSMFFFLTQFLQ